MLKGRVKWYNEKKGYELIETDDEGNVFVHKTGIIDPRFFNQQPNDRVTFEIKNTPLGRLAIHGH